MTLADEPASLVGVQHTTREERRNSSIRNQVQFYSVAQLCPTLCDPMNRGMPGFPVHHQLLESTQIHAHCVSEAIQSSHPLSSCPQSFPTLGSFQMSQLFTSGGKYWSFSFNISPSNEQPGLISFSMDWLDLLAVQGTLKSLLQHHSSKASILRCSAFFIVQLSHPYMTTGKTIALTRRTYVDKVMSLLFNMLPRLDITFPLRSKCLNFMVASPYAMILEPQKIKSATVSPLEAELKQKYCSVVHGSGAESKSQLCKEQYCIGTWSIKSMNQGKLQVVKQEMARVNTDILGISELKWTGRCEFIQMTLYLLL